MVKRLKYIGQCLEELSALGITGADDTNPATNYSGNQEVNGKLRLGPEVSADTVRVGRRFQQQLLQELPGLMKQPGEALRHHSAWYSPDRFLGDCWRAVQAHSTFLLHAMMNDPRCE